MHISTDERERLHALIQERYIRTGLKFVLSGGGESSYYFDIKAASLNGECAVLIATLMLSKMSEFPEQYTAIGGKAFGANPIVGAILTRAGAMGKSLKGSILYEGKIENRPMPGTKMILVDDVITSGGSLLEASNAFLECGCVPMGIMAIVDRQTGGVKKLRDELKIPVVCLFESEEFTVV